MMGILTHKPTGSFSLWIRPEWTGTAFRGTVPGPNWGWTLGPDALAETQSTRATQSAREPSLRVELTPSPNPAHVGRPLTLSASITNPGTATTPTVLVDYRDADT